MYKDFRNYDPNRRTREKYRKELGSTIFFIIAKNTDTFFQNRYELKIRLRLNTLYVTK